ncbi:MAG: hypothetical protein A3C55_02410 [Gammaproteobacteria bacterium RIFCSPHIGHO2_02_FULL_42_13]|nr:MAG: hypothetical protein A3C55_02410 [Gammaproteobacteria bacterium RIFCSPHIGHO2_02_FULL_42_13]OGT68556.1 MAG: hypothetical protein A3H43_00380 [Gammaproteobacteria bacterium RIFCSPLOWO2_02_FULL_42_9]
MKYDVIVFDWDGTLYDSGARIINSIQGAARELKLGNLQPEIIKSCIGLNSTIVMDRLFPQATQKDRDLFMPAYRRHYGLELHQLPVLFTGAKTVLKQLHSLGYILAVATGKNRDYFDKELHYLGLQEMFMVTRCGDEAPSKPNPQMLFEIMEHLGTFPEKVLMIGDTVHDLQLAANAGVDALAASYGVQDKKELMEHKIVGCLSDISELLSWLK